MKSQQTQETLDHLASIRRRIDELRNDWEAHHDVDAAAHQLHELAATSTGYPSIEALLLGAAQLIKRGEPAGHRWRNSPTTLTGIHGRLGGRRRGPRDLGLADRLLAVTVTGRG